METIHRKRARLRGERSASLAALSDRLLLAVLAVMLLWVLQYTWDGSDMLLHVRNGSGETVDLVCLVRDHGSGRLRLLPRALPWPLRLLGGAELTRIRLGPGEGEDLLYRDRGHCDWAGVLLRRSDGSCLHWRPRWQVWQRGVLGLGSMDRARLDLTLPEDGSSPSPELLPMLSRIP